MRNLFLRLLSILLPRPSEPESEMVTLPEVAKYSGWKLPYNDITLHAVYDTTAIYFIANIYSVGCPTTVPLAVFEAGSWRFLNENSDPRLRRLWFIIVRRYKARINRIITFHYSHKIH